ncbi:MAG TPA: hypothetical protein VFJ15_08110 [Oleiagrimonas sp.]|nr:hypothetical protein [Oleiagrimonas sp.]
MNHTRDTRDDILLAYVRGELDAAEEHALIERLRNDPALREELVWLEDIKAHFLLENFDAHEVPLFAQLQQQMTSAQRKQKETARPSIRQHLTDWFRGHALVLEGALAALIIVQAIALVAFVHAPVPPAHPIYRGAGDNCLTVSVRFRMGVTEQQIARWLGRYDASIHAGPDVQGRYRIALPSRNALNGFLSDPNELAQSVALPPGCKQPTHPSKDAPLNAHSARNDDT